MTVPTDLGKLKDALTGKLSPAEFEQIDALFGGRSPRSAGANTMATATPMTAEELTELRVTLAKASPGEWAVRPLPYDDWGWIRGPALDEAGDVRYPVCIAKAGGPTSADDEARHRRDKTDPYEHNAVAIVSLHNAADRLLAMADALIERDAEVVRLREALTDIAAFGDTAASNLLELTGSHAMFDEPGSVAAARAALTPEPTP